MEQKTLTKVQAIFAIIGGFFGIAILGGIVAQNMGNTIYVDGFRTILLLLWVISIGVIWRKTK